MWTDVRRDAGGGQRVDALSPFQQNLRRHVGIGVPVVSRRCVQRLSSLCQWVAPALLGSTIATWAGLMKTSPSWRLNCTTFVGLPRWPSTIPASLQLIPVEAGRPAVLESVSVPVLFIGTGTVSSPRHGRKTPRESGTVLESTWSVRAACAAYSSICPTIVRRISGFVRRLTSTSANLDGHSRFCLQRRIESAAAEQAHARRGQSASWTAPVSAPRSCRACASRGSGGCCASSRAICTRSLRTISRRVVRSRASSSATARRCRSCRCFDRPPALCERGEERRTERSYPASFRNHVFVPARRPIGVEPPARVLGASRRPAAFPGKVLSCVLGRRVRSEFGASQPRPDRGSSGPATLIETAVVVEPCLVVTCWRVHAPWPLGTGADRQTVLPTGFAPSRRSPSPTMPGDYGAHELSADRPEDTAIRDAGDLVKHFADDAPPEARVLARTGDGRAPIDTARAGVTAGMPGDAAGRRPSSAKRRPGRERRPERRARP